MKVGWIEFDASSPDLPPEHRLCLVQTTPQPAKGLPPAVAVGYLRIWSCGPWWVIPGVGGTVTRYADCLPDDLNPQCWPGFCKGEK